MNEQLKQAITTIAEYMGWKQIDERFWINDSKSIVESMGNLFWLYTNSADALLDVWRKVRDEIHSKYDESRTGKEWHSQYSDYESCLLQLSTKTDFILHKKIAENNYPTACIELAEIIKQLKEKV
jgi:hypothetical protein